jgi:hypothetical protein
LPCERHHGGGEQQHAERGQRGADDMPQHELGGTVAECVSARRDGQPVEMAPHVVRELLDRSVATLGFLAQRREHDRVEVSA